MNSQLADACFSSDPQDASYQRQPLLNVTHDSCSSDDEAGGTTNSGYTRRKSRHPKPASVRIDIDQTALDGAPEADEREIPAEPFKTLLAFVFLFLAWVATTTSLALTHERVPEVDPLPDLFLDTVQYQSWGLDASEIIIMGATMVSFILAVCHQHRCEILQPDLT